MFFVNTILYFVGLLCHTLTWRLPLEQYCEITQIFGDSTQAPMKGFRLSCLISLIWKEKIEINDPTYVQKCTTRTLDTSISDKIISIFDMTSCLTELLAFCWGFGQGTLCNAYYVAPCKGIQIPKSGKLLLVESGIREGFSPAIRNTAQGVRNPTSPAAGCVAD